MGGGRGLDAACWRMCREPSYRREVRKLQFWVKIAKGRRKEGKTGCRRLEEVRGACFGGCIGKEGGMKAVVLGEESLGEGKRMGGKEALGV